MELNQEVMPCAGSAAPPALLVYDSADILDRKRLARRAVSEPRERLPGRRDAMRRHEHIDVRVLAVLVRGVQHLSEGRPLEQERVDAGGCEGLEQLDRDGVEVGREVGHDRLYSLQEVLERASRAGCG